jgi:hypothetical protein
MGIIYFMQANLAIGLIAKLQPCFKYIIPNDLIMMIVVCVSRSHMPISALGCRGLMRPEKFAHLVNCPGLDVLLLFPWIYCHLGFWRQRH